LVFYTLSIIHVEIENSKKNTAFGANYEWNIEGQKIEVEGVLVADMGDERSLIFTLKPVLDKESQPSNLCITVILQN